MSLMQCFGPTYNTYTVTKLCRRAARIKGFEGQSTAIYPIFNAVPTDRCLENKPRYFFATEPAVRNELMWPRVWVPQRFVPRSLFHESTTLRLTIDRMFQGHSAPKSRPW